MADRDEALAKAARDHGLSAGAVRALWDALARGGGQMAQFSHPDLGGMGQWSDGGMIQIGDMFDHGLKARVATACADLAAAAARSDAGRAVPSGSRQSQWQGDPRRPGGSATGGRAISADPTRRARRTGRATLTSRSAVAWRSSATVGSRSTTRAGTGSSACRRRRATARVSPSRARTAPSTSGA